MCPDFTGIQYVQATPDVPLAKTPQFKIKVKLVTWFAYPTNIEQQLARELRTLAIIFQKSNTYFSKID